MPRGKSRRCKYDPTQVIENILSHPVLYKVVEVVFTSDKPLHSVDVSRRIGIGQGYAYVLLARLERWGVVEPLRDPKNGKTMFRPSSRKVAKALAEEIRKRSIEKVITLLDPRKRDEDI